MFTFLNGKEDFTPYAKRERIPGANTFCTSKRFFCLFAYKTQLVANVPVDQHVKSVISFSFSQILKWAKMCDLYMNTDFNYIAEIAVMLL